MDSLQIEAMRGMSMSRMIQCDGCKLLVQDDSSAKDFGYHEIFIDRCQSYHLCRRCYDTMMRNIFHMKYSDDERQYVEEE